jgi:uncharacterized membrane protein
LARHRRWKTKEWDAEITEQIPDERIAWRSTSGVPNSGVVTFHQRLTHPVDDADGPCAACPSL